MGYIKMLSGGVMATIFVLAITIFAVQFAAENNSDISLSNDEGYTSLNSSIRTDIGTFKSESEDVQEIYFKTSLESGDEHASSGAQYKVGALTAVWMAMKSFKTGFNDIFGPQFSFIIVALASLITIIMTLYAAKAWLGRSPD